MRAARGVLAVWSTEMFVRMAPLPHGSVSAGQQRLRESCNEPIRRVKQPSTKPAPAADAGAVHDEIVAAHESVETWAPEFGGRIGFPPPENNELVLSISKKGVCRYCDFSTKTKHPVLTRPISNPQNPCSAPKFWSPGRNRHCAWRSRRSRAAAVAPMATRPVPREGARHPKAGKG